MLVETATRELYLRDQQDVVTYLDEFRKLAGCATRLGGALAASRIRDAIVDCGRLSIETPVAPLRTAADTLLVVARPRLDELAHLTHRLPALAKASRRVGLLLIGEVPYRPDDVREAVGVGLAFIVRLASDPRAAAALNGDGGAGTPTAGPVGVDPRRPRGRGSDHRGR